MKPGLFNLMLMLMWGLFAAGLLFRHSLFSQPFWPEDKEPTLNLMGFGAMVLFGWNLFRYLSIRSNMRFRAQLMDYYSDRNQPERKPSTEVVNPEFQFESHPKKQPPRDESAK